MPASPFIKLGDAPQAAVRYLRSAVMNWLAGRSFASTSAYSATQAGRLKVWVPVDASG